MSEYIKRLGQTAVRFTGQPAAISPQLEDYQRIPNIRHPMEGDATSFRLILYFGYIDTSDVTITFPKANVMCVAVKHGIKAVDALSHRLSKVAEVPQVIRDSHCPLICSRDDVYFFSLPPDVKKSSLTAHMSQDGFLVVQKRMLSVEDEGRTGFDVKRLVVVKVCRDVSPSVSSEDRLALSLSLIENAAVLATNVVEAARPVREDYKVGTSVREEAPPREHSGIGEAGREEVVPEAEEVSRPEGSRVRAMQGVSSFFKPLHSSIETLSDLTRVALEGSRIREAIPSARRRELDESRERSQIESSLTQVGRPQQSKVPAKRVPQESSGPSGSGHRGTGDVVHPKAIDTTVRKEGLPKGKDTKEKSCVSKPSTSAPRGSSGSEGPELQSQQPPSRDESSVSKSGKIAEESSTEKGLGKDRGVEGKVAESKGSTIGDATIGKEPDFEERTSESKNPCLEKEGTASSKAPTEKKSDPKKIPEDQMVLLRGLLSKPPKEHSPKKDTKEEGKSENKDPGVQKVSERKEPTASAKASTVKKSSPIKIPANQNILLKQLLNKPPKEPSPEKDTEEESVDEEKTSDSGDSSVEEKAPESKKPGDEEKSSDSKEPSLKEKGTASAKASTEKKSSPIRIPANQNVLLKKLLSKPPKEPSPEKDTKEEGKSDSKDPSSSKEDKGTEKEGTSDSKDPSPVKEEKDTKEEGKSDSKDPSPFNEETDTEEEGKSDSKDPSPYEEDTEEEGKSDSKDPSPVKEEKGTEKEGKSNSKDPSPVKEEKGTKKEGKSDCKEPSPDKEVKGTKKKGKSDSKEPSPDKEVKGTKKEGKSDSKEPSPDKEVKEQSSLVKESSQPSRTTRRKDSKSETEAGDKVSQRDAQDAKEKKVATKTLPVRSTRAASLAATSKPPASPSKVGRSKVKEEAPGTPSKRAAKAKPKDTDASKR